MLRRRVYRQIGLPLPLLSMLFQRASHKRKREILRVSETGCRVVGLGIARSRVLLGKLLWTNLPMFNRVAKNSIYTQWSSKFFLTTSSIGTKLHIALLKLYSPLVVSVASMSCAGRKSSSHLLNHCTYTPLLGFYCATDGHMVLDLPKGVRVSSLVVCSSICCWYTITLHLDEELSNRINTRYEMQK